LGLVLRRDKFKLHSEESAKKMPVELGEASNYFKVRALVKSVFLSRQTATIIWRRMKKATHQSAQKTSRLKL